MYNNSNSKNMMMPSAANSNNIPGSANNLSGGNNMVDFSIGSMPTNYGYDESFSKEDDLNESAYKPQILIMGLRR